MKTISLILSMFLCTTGFSQEVYDFLKGDHSLQKALQNLEYGNFSAAQRFAAEAEQLYRGDDFPDGRVAAINIQSRAYYQMHMLDSAMITINEAMRLIDSTVIFPFLSSGPHFQLGAIASDKGYYEKAIVHLNESLQTSEKTRKIIEDKTEVTKLNGKYPNFIGVLKVLSEDIVILKEAYVYNYKGLCYQELNDQEQAIECFRLAHQNFKHVYEQFHGTPQLGLQIQSKLFEQVSLYHIGLSQGAIGKLEESDQCFLIAIDSLENSFFFKRHAVVGRVYESLGDNEIRRKNYRAGIKYFEKSMTIYEQAIPASFSSGGLTNKEAIAGVLIKLANNYFHINQDSSRNYLDQSLEMFRDLEERNILFYAPTKANALIEIGDLYQKYESPEKALTLYQEVLMLLNEGFKPKSYFENPKSGDAIFERFMLKCYRSKGVAIMDLYKEKGGLNLLESAFESYGNAIHILDEMRKNFTRGSLSKVMRESAINELESSYEKIYEEAMAIAFELEEQTQDAKYKEKAFAISEKSKAFILRSAIFRLDAYKEMPPKLLEEEQRIKADLFYAEKEWKKASRDGLDKQAEDWRLQRQRYKEELEAFVDRLKANESTRRFFDLQYNDNIYEMAEIQNQLLEDNRAIVEYFLTKERVYGFVISKEGLETFSKALPADFEDQVFLLRQVIQDPKFLRLKNSEKYIELSNNLHQLLLVPAQDLMTKAQNKLLIVPHGVLHHLNFEFLISDVPTSPQSGMPYNPGTFDYALNDFVFSRINSVSIQMDRLKRKPLKSNRIPLKFAGFSPSYDHNSQVPDLENLLDEITPAAKQFDDSEVALFFGSEADEQSFKSFFETYAPEILHVNAHGFINDKDPVFSFIVMTDVTCATQDNLLRVADLYTMTMEVELAVLSACDTGYGENFKNGEGVICMARGFQYAGVKNILMSLWPIESESTAVIMDFFYKGIAAGLEPAIALHQAKKEYLRTAPSLEKKKPYYWAGLVLLE